MTGKEIANSLNIDKTSKTSKRWKKVFQSDRKMRSYNIQYLNSNEKDLLLQFLIKEERY